MQSTPLTLVRTTEIIGKRVINAKNDLGFIADVVLKRDTGKVQYLVLSFGGFLGLGDKLFALPWGLFTYDDVADGYVINLDKALLKNAPGFEQLHWPLSDDSYWLTSVDYYK